MNNFNNKTNNKNLLINLMLKNKELIKDDFI